MKALSRSTRNKLYHATGIGSALDIARARVFALTPATLTAERTNTNVWPFYLSASRNLDNPYDKSAVIFTLNPAHLPRGAKVNPFNYWDDVARHHGAQHLQNEFEERIYCKRNTLPIQKFVERVALVLMPHPNSQGATTHVMRNAIKLARELSALGIELALFDTYADLRRNRPSATKLVHFARALKEGKNALYTYKADVGIGKFEEMNLREKMPLLMRLLQLSQDADALSVEFERNPKMSKLCERIASAAGYGQTTVFDEAVSTVYTAPQTKALAAKLLRTARRFGIRYGRDLADVIYAARSLREKRDRLQRTELDVLDAINSVKNKVPPTRPGTQGSMSYLKRLLDGMREFGTNKSDLAYVADWRAQYEKAAGVVSDTEFYEFLEEFLKINN